jgi:hypothetical protein
MIAEVIPDAYDAEGKKVFRPFDRRKGPRPTFPLGRYVSQPLKIKCHSIEEVRQFFMECKYVSDRELFDRDDYWQPPEEFEARKKGDCDDFAFWAWRQFMDLGYDARVVFGQHGRFGTGHAWVQFFLNGQCFLVEPQRCGLGDRFPRLSTLTYSPRFSVAWDGENLSYYQHRDLSVRPAMADLVRLLPEYVLIWGRFWLGSPIRLPRFVWRQTKSFLKNFRWIGRMRRL